MSRPAVQAVQKWICQELSRLLEFEASDEIANYILTMETANDLREYTNDLLDMENPAHKKFVQQLISKWKPPDKRKKVPDNIQVYRKSEIANDFIPGKDGKQRGKNKKPSGNSAQCSSNTGNEEIDGGNFGAKSLESSLKDTMKNLLQDSNTTKKNKFVPLFSDEGHAKTVARLPGRHSCDCLATKHNLVNNCVSCGRIVCEQEGSGPCVFCGNLVCTNEEIEILARGSKKSEKLKQELLRKPAKEKNNPSLSNFSFSSKELSSKQNKVSSNSESLPNATQVMQDGLKKAKHHKDRLLEFDKTSEKRTRVIDDQSDYFSSDSRWLNKKEKQLLKEREDELRSKKYGSRLDRKVTLDFAGRQVLEEENYVDIYDVNDSVIQTVHFNKKKEAEKITFSEKDFTDLVNPGIKHTQQAPPIYVNSSLKNQENSSRNGTIEAAKMSSRIQDKAILEMSDDGMCLSMHQPWATLLVKGIKKHEGRTWYSQHRGRLWIAATVKPPNENEIAAVEQQYKQLYNNPKLKFPKEYPVGCLLGCVDVVDVVDQEEYQIQYSSEESGSPYVFICENPHELVIKFPMKGKHKIYKLDGHIHQGAKKGIRPS